MSPPLSTLFVRWESAEDRGQPLSPEQLCPDRPELVEPIRQAIEVLRQMRRLLPAAANAESFPPTLAPSAEPPPSVSGLLLRWEEGRNRGQQLTTEVLCLPWPQLREFLDRVLAILLPLYEQDDETLAPVTRSQPLTRSAPPIPDDPHRTLPPSRGAAGALPTGYEFLGELGRGGMGVVYKARQVALNRLCALKMILSGGHAAAEEQARFLAEAEAIARISHPGIVGVFDFGTLDGLPFFSLELCEGGSLADRLRESPLPPREAAVMVEQIARAMQAAHEAGIVHRDLKPGNVLLTSDGKPRVSDFGLAKRIEGGGDTQTGAVLGTPSYMAPEQAAGKKEVGPLADVWALGAILYECLTGKPPFKAATPVETVLQVLSDEPAPLRQLNAQTPPDLETICHKCLQKEPHRRYASAAELADDLGRFLADQPIEARPVGAAERAVKWVKRNPAVAALLALVFVALAAGTAVSTWFGLDARTQATLALAREKEADKQRRIADKNAQATLEEKRKTDKALEKAETALARQLLGPMAQSGKQAMTEHEWEALWELRQNRPGGVGVRFVEEAVARGPLTIKQLRDRADLALPAAVGLDLKARGDVEALLLAAIQDENRGRDQRDDLGRAATSWDGLSSEGLTLLAGYFIRAVRDGKDAQTDLTAVLARLEATQAAALLGRAMRDVRDASHRSDVATAVLALGARRGFDQATALLLPAATKVRESWTLFVLASALEDVAYRLKPDEVAAPAALLAQAVKDVRDSGDFRYKLSFVLRALVLRMEPGQAATMLARAMKDVPDASALCALASVLERRVEGVKADWAARACAEAAVPLEVAMKDRNNAEVLSNLASALASLAVRMEPGQGAVMLARAMRDDERGSTIYSLSGALKTVAGQLEPDDAARAAALVLDAMKSPRDATAFYQLAQALAAVAARMEPCEAAGACGEAAELLTLAMKTARDTSALSYLGYALQEVAARLEPEDASKVALSLAVLMMDVKNRSALYSLARIPRVMAASLEPDDAARVAELFTQMVQDLDNRDALPDVALALAAVAGRLEAPAAARFCAPAAAPLIQGMQDAREEEALRRLWAALTAVAARLDSEEAGRAAERLIAALHASVKFPRAPVYLAGGLAAVAARLDAEQAAKLATPLLELIKTRDATVLPDLAQALATVAARLKRDEASKVCVQAVAPLAKALDARDSRDRYFLKTSLESVTAPLEPKEAVALLRQAMMTTKGTVSYELGSALETVAARMEPGALAVLLAQATRDTKNRYGLRSLARALATVAARQEPREAAALFSLALEDALLCLARKDVRNPDLLLALARALPGAIERLPPDEAARAVAQAGALLVAAMKQPDRTYEQYDLAQALLEAAPRMEPGEAAALLARAMKDVKDANVLSSLAAGLLAVTARLEGDEAAKAAALAAEPIAKCMAAPRDEAAFITLAKTLAPVLARMEPGQAATFAVQAAERVVKEMDPERRLYDVDNLTEALVALAHFMKRDDAHAFAAQAADLLLKAMTRQASRSDSVVYLARTLGTLAARMEPAAAATVAAQTAALLTPGLKDVANAQLHDVDNWTRALQAVARYLDQAETSKAAALLAEALKRASSFKSEARRPAMLLSLTRALTAVAGRLDSASAAKAAALLGQALKDASDVTSRYDLARGLAALAARMEAAEASEAWEQVAAFATYCSAKAPRTPVRGSRDVRVGALELLAYLFSEPWPEGGAALIAGRGDPLTWLVPLAATCRPPGRLLLDQQVVELLKMPTCVPEARRLILAHLGRRHGRRFADRWEFVRFATERKLDLDFASAPRRPDRSPDDRR